MKPIKPFSPPARSEGFILVTSLIFLVVITLLTVSAINSTTLQERMASNQREKSRARQAADAALRHAEHTLTNPAFDTLVKPGQAVSLEAPDGAQTNSDTTTRLWAMNDMIADAEQSNPAAFLDPDVWKPQDGIAPLSYSVDPDLDDVLYYIEEDGCITDTNPDRASNCAGGTIVYRVTARALGQNPAAVAITQSYFKKLY